MGDKLDHIFTLAAVALLGSIAIATGGCGHTASSGKPTVHSAKRRAPALVADTITLAVAHTPRGLRGDEDDDDQESKTWEKVSAFDADADRDADARDNAGRGYYDGDDAAVRDFGRPATAPELRALRSLSRRYLQAAASQDGALACSLMSAGAASVAAQYGGAGGPSYLSGASGCAAVMSRLFAHEHGEFVASLEVVAARVGAGRAYLLLGSRTSPARSLLLQRVGGAWKVAELGAEALP